jgi:hypothetical protein
MTVAGLSKADAWASLPNWQENPACAAGDAQRGGGLGEMPRRKREIVGLANEQDFPHLVELALPPGGFRSVFLEIDTSTVTDASQFAAAGVGTRPSNSIFDFASPTPPLIHPH